LGKAAPGDGLPTVCFEEGRTAFRHRIPEKIPDDPCNMEERPVLSYIRDGRIWTHPHIHALLLVPPRYWGPDYIKKRTWAELWATAMSLDYEPVVDVRRASPNKKVSDAKEDLKAAAIEAAKYTTKATDLHGLGDYIVEFHHQVKSLRLLGISSKLGKYVNNTDITEAEMLDTGSIFQTTNPLLRCIAEWCEEVQEYKITH
jgi:hypothetical protein